MRHMPQLDRVERSVRNMVRVDCEIKTETGISLMLMFDGRAVFISRSLIEEVVRQSPRKDGGHDGYIVIPQWLADKEELEYE